MGMNETPSADRVHIGFFGRRNAGKSSVINAVCGQELSIVSDIKGTTTDPVQKAMEILRDYKGVYCIESFDPRIVRWFKKHQPQILRGQLTDRPENFKGQPRLQSFALGNVLTNVLARPQFIAYGPGPKTRCARLADAMGAMRVCWTVRKEEEAAQKQDENDAVIFEFYLPEPIYK